VSNFCAFLRKKKEEMRIKTDPKSVRQEWLGEVESFLTQVKQWVNEPKQEGLLEIYNQSVELTESHLGNYQAPALGLKTDWQIVAIEPVGREAGGIGRIDMYTEKNRIIFQLTKDNGWAYRREDEGYYQHVTQSLFTHLLKDLLS